jgi:hypothetical protein
MPTPLDRQPHDLAVKQMAPLSPTDLRVPTAEEFDLDSKIGIHLFRASRPEHQWLVRPTFAYAGANTFTVSGTLATIGSPEPIVLDATRFTPPPLSDTFSQVARVDSLTLVGFTAEVSEQEDPLLGQFSYGFAGGVNSLAKENTRRYRYFWVLFYSIDTDLTIADVIAALGTAKTLPWWLAKPTKSSPTRSISPLFCSSNATRTTAIAVSGVGLAANSWISIAFPL